MNDRLTRRGFNRCAAAGLLGALGAVPAAARASTWVERTLAGLSLDAKIGQLMMPMLEDPEEARLLVERYRVGGLVCFRAAAPVMVQQTNLLQSLSRVPLLMSADFERGVGAYVDGATDLPIAMALGATNDPDLAYAAGALTAIEARAVGVQVVFAPVLDVNNNPKNPIINVRSFGGSPEQVGRLGTALARGLEEHGALATVKHFPGHGNVGTDTHRNLGVLAASRPELERIELLPFRRALTQPPSGLMASHLWVKAFDPEPVPASLSRRVIGQFLRCELGYTGLVYTDSLGMGAITQFTGSGASAQVLALQAGCDVLVMPQSLDARGEKSHLAGVARGIKAIRAAVQDGTLSRARLDQSVRRVLLAKARLGLERHSTVDLAGLAVLASPTHQQTARHIARQALTLVQDRGPLLPLRSNRRLGVVTLTNREGAGAFARESAEFVPALPAAQAFEAVQWSLVPTPAQQVAAETLARESDVLIIAAYLKVFVGDDSTDLSEVHRAAIARLKAINPQIVFISFGSPYALAAVRDLPTLICAYDDAKATQVVAAEALYASAPWTGRLPVEIYHG